jgi:uncharacterized membrane protein required for colicin V production
LLAFQGGDRNLAGMIAAAAAVPPATHGLSFGWFDMVAVAMLGFGLFRGRRNGMSKELLPVLEWLLLVSLSGLGYPMLAGLLSGFIHDPLWNNLVAYLAPALVVFVVFSILKQQFAEKLVKSSFFKGGEYYLGMLAGTIRYACVLIFLLALLNAPAYTPAQIAQMKAYDQANLGGGIFTGNYFPHLFQIQAAVFKESFLGSGVADNLGVMLINIKHPGAGGAQEPPKPKPVINIGN